MRKSFPKLIWKINQFGTCKRIFKFIKALSKQLAATAEILIMDTVLFMINNFAQRHLSTKLSINLLHS